MDSIKSYFCTSPIVGLCAGEEWLGIAADAVASLNNLVSAVVVIYLGIL